VSNEQTLGALFAEYEQNAAITVLPAGKTKLEVTACTVRNKGVCPVYKVVEGPDAGKRAMAGGIYPGDTEGGRIAFFRKLEKFGLGKEFFQANPTLEDVAKALKGRVVVVDLSVKEWQGEPRNEMGFSIELVSAPSLPPVGGVPVTTPVADTTTTTVIPTPASSGTPAVIPTVTDTDPGF